MFGDLEALHGAPRGVSGASGAVGSRTAPRVRLGRLATNQGSGGPSERPGASRPIRVPTTGRSARSVAPGALPGGVGVNGEPFLVERAAPVAVPTGHRIPTGRPKATT